MRITEIATRDISRWVSGDIRFTPKEKELLTKRARAIIADKDKAIDLSSCETRGGAKCHSLVIMRGEENGNKNHR